MPFVTSGNLWWPARKAAKPLNWWSEFTIPVVQLRKPRLENFLERTES
jgi:hypothetical protein